MSAPSLLWYGDDFTGAADTLATLAQAGWRATLLDAGPKLWCTLVPPGLRDFDRSLLAQANPWTHLRDTAFAHYQSNLFLDRKSTRLNSSHSQQSRMPSSA